VALSADATFSLNLNRQEKPVPSYLAFSFAFDYPFIVQDLASFLHPNELIYFRKLEFPLRKTSFLLGRHAAKKALAAFLQESDATQIEISIGAFNQPVVKYRSAETPELTIAHCRNAAVAIAFQSGHPMGVDLEYIEGNKSQVLESQFTSPELQRLKLMPEPDEDSYYFLWTVKEALSKALKCGLTIPFDVLEVEKIVQNGTHAYISSFKNFSQYQSFSWIEYRHVLSIALPKNTHLTLNPFSGLQAGLFADRA
jgi:4'-phosphopantetheinyl transferase